MNKELRQILRSPKIIIVFISITLLASLVGVLIPQSAYNSPQYFENWQVESPYTYFIVDQLGLNRVFSTKWFLILVLILTVLLCNTVYLQFTALIKRRKRGARKWGGFLFHLGLLIVILASFYTLSFQKRGFIQLIEGEIYPGDEKSLLSKELGVFADSFNPGFLIRLNKFEHSYWENGAIKELDSLLTVKENGFEEKVTLGINHTHIYNGVKLYQARDYGYTLYFIFKRKSGDGFYTLFNIDRQSNRVEPSYGITEIPTTPYIIKVKFFPDYTKSSYYLNKPTLDLGVERGVKEVYKGMTFPGQTVLLPDNEGITWTGVRYWSGIRLVQSKGTPIVFIGFGLSIAGLLLLYIIPRKN